MQRETTKKRERERDREEKKTWKNLKQNRKDKHDVTRVFELSDRRGLVMVEEDVAYLSRQQGSPFTLSPFRSISSEVGKSELTPA